MPPTPYIRIYGKHVFLRMWGNFNFKKLKNAVSTNNPTIHPRKNEKGTDDVNQTFHLAILFLLM